MNTATVGRIVDLDRFREPLPICARCILLEHTIREHKRERESAMSWKADGVADTKLWKVVGL